MRAQSWILIIIALGCGLVASIGISQVMERGDSGEGAEIEMEDIFIAIVDIPIGDPITSQMIKLDKWPKDKIPEGAITKLEEVEKRRPRSRVYKGEPILLTKLIGADDKGPELPAGYRAVAIKVTPEDIIGGLVKPGDRVDLLVFVERGPGSGGNHGDGPSGMIKTFLRGVRIFAIDASYERDPGKEGKAVQAKTITLEVKPQDSEKIMLAQQVGKIRLVLRGANDTVEDTNDEEMTVDKLFGTQSARAEISTPVVQAQPVVQSPVVDPKTLLDALKSAQPIGETGAKPVAVARVDDRSHRITILAGPGMDVYDLKTNQMPTVIFSSPNVGVGGVRPPASFPPPLTHDNPGDEEEKPSPKPEHKQPARE